MITTILFDFYGVFQTDVYGKWLETNKFTRTGQYLAVINELDAGTIDREEFINRLSTQIGRRVTYDEIYHEQELDSETIQIAKSLKQKYKLGLISNASSNLREKLAKHNLIDVFDQIVISSEVGIAKPHPQLYHHALENLQAQPQEVLYIDDNPEYIRTGMALGMKTILFTSADSLQAELKQLNLI